MNSFGELGIAVNVNAHHDRAAFFDFADFAQGDVVAEAGHQFRLQVQRAQIAGGDARQHEKNHSADEQRADGDQRGRQAQRAIQAMRERRARFERGRNGIVRAAANFQRDECGHGQHQKNCQRDQESGFDGEDRRSQHAGDRQHRQKCEIAIAARGKQAHQSGKQHQVDRSQQRGIKRGVRRALRNGARQDPKVNWKKKEVTEDQAGGGAHGNFGAASAPQAASLVNEHDYGDDRGENVEFAGADDGENARRDQQEQRHFKITLHRRERRSAEARGGDHGRSYDSSRGDGADCAVVCGVSIV